MPVGDKRKVKIEKKRQVLTYADLWHTSRCLLEKGQEQEKGSFHQFMASLVFTTFSLEAYLNHVGPKIFRCWDVLERLTPQDKLNIIAEQIKLPIDYGRRPWGIVKELFGFRNYLAHGKTTTVAKTLEVPISKHDSHMERLRRRHRRRFAPGKTLSGREKMLRK